MFFNDEIASSFSIEVSEGDEEVKETERLDCTVFDGDSYYVQTTIYDWMLEKERIEAERARVTKANKTKNPLLEKAERFKQKMREDDMEHISKIDKDFPYEARKLVTDAELKLYQFMQDNLIYSDRIQILTKVRLADLIDLDEVYSKYITVVEQRRFLYSITSKHIDFVICRKDNLKVICAFELDDFTHSDPEAIKRDVFKINALGSAGVQLLRYGKPIADIQEKDLDSLNVLIGNEFAPRCSKCGNQMLTKKNAKNNKFFLACFNNFDCKHTLDLEEI